MKQGGKTTDIRKDFSANLLKWYRLHKRDLPWRNTRNPYRIWLSEIILQQTRIDQGLPYYEKFLASFPSVKALARASEQDVLRLWQGLGYYSRARNLHACAIKVDAEFGGKFPESYGQLIRLPGIGPYTAAAIASFCFDERIPALDGNSIRVLSRYFNFTENIASQASRRRLTELSTPLMPQKHPGWFNQALMDFGSMQCVTPVPDCRPCPLSASCGAFQTGRQAFLPVKGKKPNKKDRYFHFLIFEQDGLIYMKKRTGQDIWHGLFEFYLIETGGPTEPEQLHGPGLGELLDGSVLTARSGEFRHLLTHQNLHIRFYRFEMHGDGISGLLDAAGYRKFDMDEIEQLPKPIIIERYLKEKII